MAARAMDPAGQRLAWALTGSGHFFTECLDIINRLDAVDSSSAVPRRGRPHVQTAHRRSAARDASTRTRRPRRRRWDSSTRASITRSSSHRRRRTRRQMVCGISGTLATNVLPRPGSAASQASPRDTAPRARHDGAGRDGQSLPAPHRLDNVRCLRTSRHRDRLHPSSNCSAPSPRDRRAPQPVLFLTGHLAEKRPATSSTAWRARISWLARSRIRPA
jgi:hypothetical protein